MSIVLHPNSKTYLMKKLKLLISLLFLSVMSFAQGGGFNYKALLTDNGNALNNQTVSIRFTVLENGTSNRYQETHSTTTDSNGIVTVIIGEGTVVSGDFVSINWGANSYFLKVEIDSGNGYDDFGTTEFKAVPYAKYAETGGSVQELDDLSDARNLMDSVYIGDDAGENDDGSNYKGNTGVGAHALQHVGIGATGNFEGKSNTAFGSMALNANTKGHTNTALGSRSLVNLTTTWGNTAVGYNTLYDNNGYANTVIGSNACRHNVSGNYNVAIGYRAGFNETGSNKLYIENSDSDSPLIYGEFDNDIVEINGKLNIANQTTISTTGGQTGALVINDDGSNDRPGIQFTNNTSQYISGDDQSNEMFGFYSLWSSNRTHDALLRVYGKSTSSWGKYTEITHNGTDGKITTDTGDLILNPNGNVKVEKKITSSATGTADLKPFAYGSVNYDYGDGTIIIDNDTGNFSVYLDNTGVFQVRLYDTNGNEIAFNHENFTVIANVYYNGPAFISFHTYSNRLYFTIYHEGSTSMTLPFSFIVYKN